MATLLGSRRQILFKGSDLYTFANLQLANGLQDSGTSCKYINVSLLARCQVPDEYAPQMTLLITEKLVFMPERAASLQLDVIKTLVDSRLIGSRANLITTRNTH